MDICKRDKGVDHLQFNFISKLHALRCSRHAFHRGGVPLTPKTNITILRLGAKPRNIAVAAKRLGATPHYDGTILEVEQCATVAVANRKTTSIKA
jgi:hypothetical protein